MDISGQGEEYLRLKRENHDIQSELTGIRAAIHRIALCFQANADVLKKDPASWTIDTGLLAADVIQAGKNVERYRELLCLEESNRVLVEEFEGSK